MNNVSTTTTIPELAARSASLIFITLLSMFGNFLVSITLYRRPYLLTPSNKLVFSLTTTNFVFSFIVLPFVIVSSITEQWHFGRVWCHITGFLTLLVVGASMLILATIACDRYHAIVHPMSYPRVITGFRATVTIVACWLLSAACAAPPLFGAWSRYQFQPHRCGCLPVWQEQLGFTVFWFVLCFFMPYVLMLGCYAFIFKVARAKTRQVHAKIENPSRFAGPSDDTTSNSSDSASYTEVSDTFPTTRVIGANSTVTTRQVSNGKIITKAEVNDITSSAVDADSGINVSESTSPANDILHSKLQPVREIVPRSHSDYSRLHLPNQVEPKESPKFMCRRNSNVTDGEGTSSAQTEAEQQLKNSRKSSNASIISSTSQVFRRTSLAFSAVRYYSNQMKAVFTIAFILGILLLTMGPFVVVALIEAADRGIATIENAEDEDFIQPSLVSKRTLSVSTCFMYLTCVYYPLIYGLWNRTVRKEMQYLLCGYKHKDHRRLNRTRILSLTTHIQDLGMSPGLTAAIIGESDPSNDLNANFARERHCQRRSSSRHIRTGPEEVTMPAVNKRRHTLHSLSDCSILPQPGNGVSSSSGLRTKKRCQAFRVRSGIGAIAEESDLEGDGAARSSNAGAPQNCSKESGNVRRWRRDYSINTVSHLINEPESRVNGQGSGGYKMRLQTKDDVLIPVSYDHHSKKENDKNHSRAREKPATSGLLELSSAEVLGSTALSSALLFAGYDFQSRRPRRPAPSYQQSTRPVSDAKEEPQHSRLPDTDEVAEMIVTSPESKINEKDLAMALGNIPVAKSRPKPVLRDPAVAFQKSDDDDDDKIAVITEGRLHGSHLVHLEAGEPKNIRKWSRSQFVDFFASSVAYGVVEAGKVELQADEERCPSRN